MRKAFTLSEVMLVLSVIGMIAALTIPGIIQSTQEKQALVKLKKEYSTLSQGINSMIANDDMYTAFDNTDDATSDVQTLNTLAKYVNIIKICGTGSGCWYNTPLKSNNGTVLYTNFDVSLGRAKAILADGAMIFIDRWSNGFCQLNNGNGPLQNTCAFVGIDVNGSIGPNTSGKDYFGFWLTRDGLVPAGAHNDININDQTCNNTEYERSTGCTFKVLSDDKIK